uniref:Uncharacterized protein n=1 Tax=Anguilla anguilla TaxID=7936 RepID=A0A0E9VP88_ANGAN
MKRLDVNQFNNSNMGMTGKIDGFCLVHRMVPCHQAASTFFASLGRARERLNLHLTKKV